MHDADAVILYVELVYVTDPVLSYLCSIRRKKLSVCANTNSKRQVVRLIKITDSTRIHGPNSFVPNTLIECTTEYESKSHFESKLKEEE